PTYAGTATDDAMVTEVEVKARLGATGSFTQRGVTCTGCGTRSATWTWTPLQTEPLGPGTYRISFRSRDNDTSVTGGLKSPEPERTLVVP
ncbi:MAG: hypothetical protein ACRDH5_11680, partial [bacterium]